jgi:hypothetical protein
VSYGSDNTDGRSACSPMSARPSAAKFKNNQQTVMDGRQRDGVCETYDDRCAVRRFGRLVIHWRRWVAIPAACVLVAAVGALPSASRASTGVSPELFQKVSTGVALIKTFGCDGRGIAQGTGFLVGESVVMTARHVVRGACRVSVRVNGETFDAQRWTHWSGGGASPVAADLETVKLPAAATGAYVFRIRSSSPPLGTNLGMVGHPLGNRLSLNQGKLIQRGRVNGVPLLAVKMLGAEGASGAPFIDDAGRVVGILQIGLGSKDILGQRTAGALVGLDLVRWWGPRARLDLCRAYPKGGIAGCTTSTPTPQPTPSPVYPISVTGTQLGTTRNPSENCVGDGSVCTTFGPTVGRIYFDIQFETPSIGKHSGRTTLVAPDGSMTSPCSGSIGVGWTGINCSMTLPLPAQTGDWSIKWSIDNDSQSDTVRFTVAG